MDSKVMVNLLFDSEVTLLRVKQYCQTWDV